MTYGTLGGLPVAFQVLNLFDVHEMQAIAALEFEEVAGRKTTRISEFRETVCG